MKKLTKVLILAIVLIMIVGTVFPSAAEPYDTYTYSIDGETLKSPPAFSAVATKDAIDMKLIGVVNSMSGDYYYNDDGNGEITLYQKNGDAVTRFNVYYEFDGNGDKVYYFNSEVTGREDYKTRNVAETDNKKKSYLFTHDIGDFKLTFVADTNNEHAYDGMLTLTDPRSNSFSNTISDIVTDDIGNIYISDTDNKRVIVLNKYYEAINIISTYEDEIGRERILNSPRGVFVTDPEITADGSSYIFICNQYTVAGEDGVNTIVGEVVVFDRDYNYVRTITKPESEILSADAFRPDAVAVDKYGRVFIVSHASYEGVIVLSADGAFTGFIGAQEVTASLLDQIWRKFMSQEQLQNQKLLLADPYNNITVDDDGFVYVTTSSTKEDSLQNQFASIKTKKATYSPIKKLNAQVDEIMKRNGFFDPGGEVVITWQDVSTITDVAIGSQDTYTILDTDAESGRFFTYDQSGNLLFAFGTKGDQLGQGANLAGITYHVLPSDETADGLSYRLLSLSKSGTITIYDATPYYYAIMDALACETKNDYVQSRIAWQNVLSLNNNFDLAYIGIGKAYYHQGEYELAMEYLEMAYETDVWSKASGAAGEEMMQVWLFPIIIGVLAILILFFKFMGYAKKINNKTALKVGRKSYIEELLYSFHLVFHPFDGFWDLKHEKRGSVRGATTILLFTAAAFFYQSIGRGYPFNPRGESINILLLLAIIAVVFFLFCISNWCLTTLFEGEGSFKDIYIAAGYSLSPMPLFIIISTILTNVLTIESETIISLISTLGIIWMAILLFFGMMVSHDYSIKKNLVTIIGTIVAMLVIAFIAVLFFSLVAKMIGFIVDIFTEFGNRI